MGFIRFKLVSERGLIVHLNGVGRLDTYVSRKPGLRNRDIPDKARFRELGFKTFISRSLDVEEYKGASDVEEKGSHGEMPPGTNPVR